MTVHSSGEQIEAILGALRAEEPHEQDAAQQAVLHHESGVLEEHRGDDDAAAQEYLAACNSEPAFREPLEALVRIYQRKRDDSHLPRLLEALVDVSTTPAQSARALWELAVFRQRVEEDLAQARGCLEAAVETEPSHAAAWLEYELLAVRDRDVEARMRAVEARQNLTTNPTWQGLLLIQLAELCAEAGDVGRASELLDTVVALEGQARFSSRLALEAVARKAEDHELLAHALEGQAELITQAIDDPEAAERTGVPSPLCTAAHAADVWLRAGEVRRRAGDPWGAVAALTGAAEQLPDNALVAQLRIAAADAAGDEAAVLDLAREQLERGVSGSAGAALWLRLGQAAEASEDEDTALAAYGQALALDPNNIAALALRTDLLAQGEDPEALAAALEAQADQAGSKSARARAWITVAYVSAVRAGLVEDGKKALARAAELGTGPIVASRLARSFASLCDDDEWYGEATHQLLEHSTDPMERGSLCFELGRARLLSKDDAGAVEAFAMLAAAAGEDDGSSPSSWLGRALAAYAVGLRAVHREPRDGKLVGRLAEAEPDEKLGQGLTLVAAMLKARQGDVEQAFTMLAKEHERDPEQVVVALFLADLHRGQGHAAQASRVLADCAAACSDPVVAAALQLEAGFLLWNEGERDEAVAAFEQSLELAPEPGRLVLAWALRGAKPDDLDTRRRAIEMADEEEDDVVCGALERFGLGVATRDGETDARVALEQLEELDPGGDIAIAAALAALLHSGTDSDGLTRALEQVELLGGAASMVARAEQFRLARFEERDADSALRAARQWAEAEPSAHTCLEWLAAAFAADDRDEEIAARAALADHLEGDAAATLLASAAMVRLLHQPTEQQPLLRSPSEASLLCNLELALPGSDPSRRAAALRHGGAVLGEAAEAQGARMAAWSDLAAGAYGDAQAAFRLLVEADADDIASWEGLREASEKVGDHVTCGVALAQLGNLCQDDAHAGELWEQAGLVLLEHTDAKDDAEIAFQRALERDKTRAVAFDKLFRAVRARNEDNRQLELIDLRVQVCEDTIELTKMYWERARVLRRMGDQEAALKSLKDVTMLEPDHVGALALSGEISITRGEFAEAAPLLARLATLDEAPQQQRLMSGVAAVDLYEKRLKKPDKALEVLLGLYRDGLSTLKVRERLARTSARVGNWDEAVKILERLMEERDSSEGRAEAARLAMAIYRDKLNAPQRAAKAVRKLLIEVGDDREGVQLLIRNDVSEDLKSVAVPNALRLLLERHAADPFDRERVELIAEIAESQGNEDLCRAALGCAQVLGNDSDELRATIANISARADKVPELVLDADAILAIADNEDAGPIPEIFAQVATAVSDALGPSLKSEKVGRKHRVDGGERLRIEISHWMGALGFTDFELYMGGRDAQAVKGVAGDRPMLVVGEEIKAPLDMKGRSAIAREVFALRRGTTSVIYCDEHTVASIVTAVCIDAGVSVPAPPYAVYAEVQRVIKKAMSRKLRKLVVDACQRAASSQQDALEWVEAARRSIDRMALIASGDPASVVDQIVGPVGTPGRANLTTDDRAKRLLVFALSSEYMDLRRKLGMGVA